MAFGQYLGYIGGVIGAVIGGVIGTYVFPGVGTGTGALWGFSIGSMVGGVAGQVFWPERADLNLPPPPQPHETRLQFSSWGAAIPIQYASGRLAGNIIYMSDIVETIERSRHRQDGVRYYEMVRTYTATFAIAFCEGPVPGIARIWMNNKVIVDFRDPLGPYYPTGSMELATANLETAIARSEVFFSFYFGIETQTANAAMVALLTEAETPTYRGICYIVLNDFPIGEFSGVPNIEIEIGEIDEIVAGSPGSTVPAETWTGIDFLSFTEFDYDNFIGANSSTVTITAAGNDSLCYYAIFNPNYGADREFRFGFNVASLGGANYQECALIQVQETFGADTVQVQIAVGPASLTIYLQSNLGGSDSINYPTASYPFARYVRLAFTTAGVATLRVYTDSGYTTLEDTLEITGTNFSETPNMQYVAIGLVSALGESDRSPLNMTISNLQVL